MNLGRTAMAIVVVTLLLLTIGESMNGFASISASTKANESIHTDKSIYVMGEMITIFVHGDASTDYYIYVNGYRYHWITTNSTGDYTDYISTYNGRITLGSNTIELRNFPNAHTVLATSHFEVRNGLEFWPSKYTNSNTVYLSGETLWVKLTGEDYKEYRINITDNHGNVVYPEVGNNVTVTTDSSGVCIFNVTLSMGDGSYSMNLYNGSLYIQSKDFTVTSVEISASIDKNVYLLSEKIHGFVTIYWLKTHTVIKNAEYKWWIINASNPNEQYGPYFEEKNSFYTYPLNVYVNATGKKIGVNQEYILRIEYNMTNSTGLHYGTKDIYFYTGHLRARINLDALDGSFSPGKRVSTNIYTYVEAERYGMESSLGNVTVNYLNISALDHWEVLWYENRTDMGITDVAGHTSYIWVVPNLEVGTYVKITAEVSMNDENYIAASSFNVQSGASSSIKLNKEPIGWAWTWWNGHMVMVHDYSYLAGDVIQITVNTQTPENVMVTNYEYKIYSGSRLMYYTSSNSSMATYKIPLNYSGKLDVYETTYFSTGENSTDIAIVYVNYGSIYLQASQYYFKNPGDKINIYVQFESNVMHPSNYTVKVFDYHNQEISKVTIPFSLSTNYTFIVPNENSDVYSIEVEAIDGTYYTSNVINVWIFTGYEVHAYIKTKSKFENGIYEPGQTIEIAYSIVKYGDFQSHNLLLYWAIAGTDYVWNKRIESSELNGTITLAIPSDIRGNKIIEVWTEDSEGHNSIGDAIGINVEKGTWSMQSIAGMPMGTFLNLILVIIALVLVIVALFMIFWQRKSKVRRPRAPQPFKAPPQPIQKERIQQGEEKSVEAQRLETGEQSIPKENKENVELGEGLENP